MFDGAGAGDRMSLDVALILGLVLVATGVLFMTAAVKSRSGSLPRNWIVGIRTTATLASDEAWLAAHRAAATPMAVGALFSLGAGLPVMFRPSNGVGLSIVVIGMVGMLACIMWGGRAATRAARSL